MTQSKNSSKNSINNILLLFRHVPNKKRLTSNSFAQSVHSKRTIYTVRGGVHRPCMKLSRYISSAPLRFSNLLACLGEKRGQIRLIDLFFLSLSFDRPCDEVRRTGNAAAVLSIPVDILAFSNNLRQFRRALVRPCL